MTCESCGVPFEEHLGIVGTCAKLQVAVKALKEIVAVPDGSPRSVFQSMETCLGFRLGRCKEYARKALAQIGDE